MSAKTTGAGKQIKVGVVISYTLILLNTLYGMFVTPYIISCLGDAEYGVYKTISALGASLMVLDLGIGSTVMRYISKYNAAKEEDKIPNFLAMMFIQAGALCGAVLVVGFVIFFFIGPVYSKTFTDAQISKAQLLFVILLFNMALHVIQNVFNGIITGSNKMIFGNGIKLVRLLSRIILLVVLLTLFKNSLAIVLLDLTLTASFLLIEIVYVFFKLKIRVKLKHWEKSLFLESGKYTLMMFLTSIAAQVNNNLDNVLIGAISGAEFVTVYSLGLMIFAMYENLSTSISGIMLPTVTNALHQENGMKKVIDLVVQAGRVQFMLLGAAVVGFAIIGKEFLLLWLGEGFEDIYIITLILMIPSLFELCVNVCLSILRAKNMLTFRTGILFASTALNAVVTIVAVSCWSYIGAAIGTATSFIIGSLIVMNIYYYKKLKLPMLKIYARIFHKIWICLALAGGALYLSSRYLYGSLWTFLANVAIFCVVYGATLLLFGLDKAEMMHIPVLKKFVKNKR